MIFRPSYLSLGWSSHIQAEGQLYFYHSQLRFVTETNIYDAEKLKRLSHWMAAAGKLADAQDFMITNSIEVMLQLDDNDDSCGYYVVDHDNRTVFWLQDVSSEDLDIPASVSMTQLRWNSNEFYWTHVEYFSAHLPGIRMSCARELFSILTHARADHLTSTVGTFPYGAEQCKEFMDLLRDHVSGSSEVLADRYIICVVARLWGQVARHRFLNFYGEENARLSRDQRVVNNAPKDMPFLFKMFSRTVLFNIPEKYSSELDGLWVDNLVYAEPWKVFVKRVTEDWKETAVWTTALTSMHAMVYFGALGSSTVGIAAIALSILGFIISMALSIYHQMSLNYETLEAASFLDRTCHSVFGFAPLSWMYSIPKAVLFWSSGLIILQGGFALFKAVPISNHFVAGGLVGLIVAVLCGVAYALHLQGALLSCFSFFRTFAHRDGDLERNDGIIDNKI